MKRVLVIPTDGEPYTVMTPDSTYEFISATCGGLIDCVRGESFVGYVNDTGLIDGLPMNPLASILFGRYLAGPCVVVGAYNAQGEYDGDDHSIDPVVVGAVKRQHLLSVINEDAKVK